MLEHIPIGEPARRLLRSYAPTAVLVIGCLFVWQAGSQVSVPLSAPLASLLPPIGGYRVQAQTIPDDERRVAAMTDYVARVYWRDSTFAFSTYVAYYDRQTRGKSIHSPRNCLPGAGWEVLTGGVRTIEVAGKPYQVNRYLLKNHRSQSVVYYWYEGRGHVVANEYAVRWKLLQDAALHGRTEEALARVVVPIEPDSSGEIAPSVYAAADSLGQQVSAGLISRVATALPHWSSVTKASMF